MNIDAVFNSFESRQWNVQTPRLLLIMKFLLVVIKYVLLFLLLGEKNEKIKINRCIADNVWHYTVQYLLSKDLHSQYHRMKELELSHKTLLVMIDQLNVKVHQVENANVRVKGKVRVIWEELMNLVRRILFQMT